MRTHRFVLLPALLGLLALAVLPGMARAGQADLDREVDQLIADYRARSEGINLIARRIKWSGITDPRLFDPIEADVLAGYATARTGDEVQYQSWLVQLLAFSGQEKYRATLQQVLAGTPNSKLKRHTESSLRVLPDYARWNPVIAAGTAEVPADAIRRKRVTNMLTAADHSLARAGASFVYDEYARDTAMTDLVRDQLVARSAAAQTDTEAAEAVAWLCKVLGASGNAAYAPVLAEVKQTARQPAVVRWSTKALRQLEGK